MLPRVKFRLGVWLNLVRALRWGRRDCWFKSSHPDRSAGRSSESSESVVRRLRIVPVVRVALASHLVSLGGPVQLRITTKDVEVCATRRVERSGRGISQGLAPLGKRWVPERVWGSRPPSSVLFSGLRRIETVTRVREPGLRTGPETANVPPGRAPRVGRREPGPEGR